MRQKSSLSLIKRYKTAVNGSKLVDYRNRHKFLAKNPDINHLSDTVAVKFGVC
jgi:hypothetical protein